MTIDHRNEQLANCKLRLVSQAALENKQATYGEALQGRQVNADSKIAELQEQLERLTNHKKELEVSTLKNDEKLSSKRSEVSNIRAEISTIKVAPC